MAHFSRICTKALMSTWPHACGSQPPPKKGCSCVSGLSARWSEKAAVFMSVHLSTACDAARWANQWPHLPASRMTITRHSPRTVQQDRCGSSQQHSAILLDQMPWMSTRQATKYCYSSSAACQSSPSAVAQRIADLRPFTCRMDLVTRVNANVAEKRRRLGPSFLPMLRVDGAHHVRMPS